MTVQPTFKISGGKRLTGGEVSISGSPNQVTKAIVASLLCDEDVIIKGAPAVGEREVVEQTFKLVGGTVEHLERDVVKLNAKQVHKNEIPLEHCMRNRISILFAGPLLHRFKKVKIGLSLGGDKIGKRPVNFHIEALKSLGAIVETHSDHYEISMPESGLVGSHIKLAFPSVMTTENILITASLAKGRTIIENAATEPEVLELAKMLQKMGADIVYNANRQFIIHGVEKLKGCEIRCMIDRNEAVSFAVAALATGGDVLLKGVPHDPVYSFINYVQRMGADFNISSKGLFVKAPTNKNLQGTHIEVDVHPGFMTDWQQPFMVLFTQAEGVSVLHETVFENRLSYCELLKSMGANINTTTACMGEVACRYRGLNHTHSAIVQGKTELHGKSFSLPQDIRAGACLLIAGLVAKGQTKLTNIHELERKYDSMIPKLQSMGADVSL